MWADLCASKSAYCNANVLHVFLQETGNAKLAKDFGNSSTKFEKCQEPLKG